MADAEPTDAPAAAAAAGGGKKKKTRKPLVYGTYLHEIVKKKTPDHKISGKSMYVLNSLVEDLLTRLRDESVRVAKFNKKTTLSSNHVKTATKMLFTGEICSNAVAEGTAACNTYFAKDDKTD